VLLAVMLAIAAAMNLLLPRYSDDAFTDAQGGAAELVERRAESE
jgi:hypothetical protein